MAGKVVISDRFEASTYAYQVWAGQGDEATCQLFLRQRELFAPALAGAWTTIILDIDAETSIRRIATRTGQALTHFDTRDSAFREIVRDGFHAYHGINGDVTFVDAARTPCLVHQDIIAVFDKVLGGPIKTQ